MNQETLAEAKALDLQIAELNIELAAFQKPGILIRVYTDEAQFELLTTIGTGENCEHPDAEAAQADSPPAGTVLQSTRKVQQPVAMKYFTPLFYLLVALSGLSLSVYDLERGRGSWVDWLLIVLHMCLMLQSLTTIDKRAQQA